MKRLTITGLVVALSAVGAAAQQTQPADTTLAPAPQAPPPPTSVQQPAPVPPPAATPQSAPASRSSFREKIYYGGSVTLSFSGATRIGIFPMIAYKVTPKLSLGVEFGYEWVDYDEIDESSNNYGGSVFARYRLVPQLYAHAEYQVVSYEFFTRAGDSSRDEVPFLLLGGGYVKRLGRASAYAEVLFDVLQDDKSPYDDWEPFFSFGVGVGF